MVASNFLNITVVLVDKLKDQANIDKYSDNRHDLNRIV